jgi:transcriptional regulator with XRE-family HTH domain
MPRKPFPTSPKTLGDHIQVKRLEKGLSRQQLAQAMRVTVERLNRLENDAQTPTTTEWQALITALSLEESLIQRQPNT